MVKRPITAFISVSAFLVLVATAALVLYRDLYTALLAAPVFNALIAAALIAGVGALLWRLALIDECARWIRSVGSKETYIGGSLPPNLLTPASLILDAVHAKKTPPVNVDSVLDSVAARIEESREFSRYFGGVVIFLGLLGTFWGLFHTVAGVGAVVGGLSIGEGDLPQVFDQLKAGLNRPLAGMATSFSASLFGLASAIILGFLETIVSSSQSRFLNTLEDWLRDLSRGLESAPVVSDSLFHSDPRLVQSLAETTNANINTLCQQLKAHEDVASQERKSIRELVALLASLADRIELDDQILRKIGENQVSLKPGLDQLTETLKTQLPWLQEKWVTHLSRIEALIQQLSEEASVGRQQIGTQLRQEMSALQRAVTVVRRETP